MPDVVDPPTRSRMMSGIRGKNTKPELIIRRYLHSCGFRFRLHRKDLPGQPDLILPKYKTVIFVHGCFWHRHGGCKYATSPKSRASFWEEKLGRNVIRDQEHLNALIAMGWRVVVVWECGLKHSFDKVGELKEMIATESRVDLIWPSEPPRPKMN